MTVNDGFRLGVGVILVGAEQQVFWGRRADLLTSWQFPQGGVQAEETPRIAMYRELYEEIGLEPHDVELLASSKGWHTYTFPEKVLRETGRAFRGQRQRWYVLGLRAPETSICLTRVDPAEFVEWKWVPYWEPLQHIVPFKRDMYEAVLREFAPVLGVSDGPVS